MGMIMIFTGIGVISAAVILTILFRIKRPVYNPEKRLTELNGNRLSDDPYNRVTVLLDQSGNSEN